MPSRLTQYTIQPIPGFSFLDGVFEPDLEHVAQCLDQYLYPFEQIGSIDGPEATQRLVEGKLSLILGAAEHFIPLYVGPSFWADVEQILVSGKRQKHHRLDGTVLEALVLGMCGARVEYKRNQNNRPISRGLPLLADKINRAITRFRAGEHIRQPNQSWDTLTEEWGSKQHPLLKKTGMAWPFWSSDTSDSTGPRETSSTSAGHPVSFKKPRRTKRKISPSSSDEDMLDDNTRPKKRVALASDGPRDDKDTVQMLQDIDHICEPMDQHMKITEGHPKGSVGGSLEQRCYPAYAIASEDRRELLEKEPDDFYQNVVGITGQLTELMKEKVEAMGSGEGDDTRRSIADLSACLGLGLQLAGKQWLGGQG